jgi:hypothetical protein
MKDEEFPSAVPEIPDGNLLRVFYDFNWELRGDP